MNYISNKLLVDLEIINKVIPNINRTITTYGDTKFKEMFNTLLFNENHLLRRREIIESVLRYPKNKKKIIIELKKIKKYQKSISWLFSDLGKEFKDLYFKKDYFNSEDLLSAKNFLKIYTPSIIILVYLFIYIIMRYYGINIDIKEYITGIYNSYKMFISAMLSLFMENLNLISLITNILATMYLLYQCYSIYSSFDSSLCHYNKCYDFKSHISNITNFMDSCKKIYKLDRFLIFEKKLLLKNIKEIDKLFDRKLNKMGYKLLIKKNKQNYEIKFNSLLEYIGLIDSFINVSNMILYSGYTFPKFDFSKNINPYIQAYGLWSPYVNYYDQIRNDCILGKPNTIILTGPNTSGKSTYIRNIMLAIFMSQTLGITCCTNLTFTPFSFLFTYLDIPNIARNKESLFESEILRCMEYCTHIENMDVNEFTFTIMDEILTGTNPKEGIAASYAFTEYIGHFDNSLNIITSHFMELTDLEKEYPDQFKNMRFRVNEKKDGSFSRSYMIEEGKADQHIAIKLLKNKGYNNFIVNRALQKLKEL